MKHLILLLITASFLFVQLSANNIEKTNTEALEILSESQKKHDPQGKWDTAVLDFHIQEPRPQTPQRFSKLKLDNGTGAFSLIREYEPGIIERLITKEGEAQITLNGSSDIPYEVRERYRLHEATNAGYREFYQLLNGLPMSLKPEKWDTLKKPEILSFDGEEVYSISVMLKDAIITKQWELLITTKDYSLSALKFVHDDGEGPNELIVFDGAFEYQGMELQRFRHWYSGDSREYLGSDVLFVPAEK